MVRSAHAHNIIILCVSKIHPVLQEIGLARDVDLSIRIWKY